MKFEKYITEKSLSRAYHHIKLHDAGLITAFRYARDCGAGDLYTKAENLARNKSLLAKLMTKGYSVTKVKGSYIENYNTPNAVEVGENAFFVVDIKDTGNLKNDLKSLGGQFEQDSILFIHSGGERGELIGTNKCPDSFPGYGKINKLKNPVFGKSGEFSTKIKGRPFILKESFEEIFPPQNNLGKWSMSIISRKD